MYCNIRRNASMSFRVVIVSTEWTEERPLENDRVSVGAKVPRHGTFLINHIEEELSLVRLVLHQSLQVSASRNRHRR